MPRRRRRCKETHIEGRSGNELRDACTLLEVRQEICEGVVLDLEMRVREKDVERLKWRSVQDQNGKPKKSVKWITYMILSMSVLSEVKVLDALPVIPMFLIRPSCFIFLSSATASSTIWSPGP